MHVIQDETSPVLSPRGASQKGLRERGYGAPRPQEPDARASSKTMLERVLLLISLITGVISHGYHLFLYPLYVTDEGIYMQQAWSVLREGQLSPYTYSYDHAPAGWLVIAAWVSILPHQFQAFGNSINTGRILMLIVHVASVFLLFQSTRRLSGSISAAVVACFLFNLSPLAVFYQREVLLDNLLVFWLLLSLYLATSDDRRIITPLLSGLALGVCVLTKENAIFFVPVVGFLLYGKVRQRSNYRFALGFWLFTGLAIISQYFLYAVLKNELLPSHLNFNLNTAPADHVSLLYSIWWQLHRSQGSILDLHSYFWVILDIWLAKDGFILVAGIGALFLNLLIGVQNRRHQGFLIAALLAASYAFYIVRGSDMLEFYVVPLIPFLAMNLGMLVAFLMRPLSKARPKAIPIITQGVVATALFVTLLSPVGGY